MSAEKNLSDQIASRITGNAVNILRLAEHMQATVLKDLEDLEAELVADLMKAIGRDATQFTKDRLAALLRQTRETIGTAYDGIIADSQEAAIRLARVIADTTVAAMNGAIGASVVSVAISADKLVAIAQDIAVFGKLPWQWWKEQDARLRDRFAREIRMGLFRGETVDDMIRRVRGTKANGYTDGIMQASRSNAAALVRTSVQAVQGEVSQTIYENNRDVIKGVQWLSTLDNRTTEICIALDGKQWQFPAEGDNYADYTPIGHDKEYSPPPAHWNCRSTIIPITYSWEELAGEHGNSAAAKAADKVPAGTRASMDGQVAATTTYEEWLAGQSEAMQDEVLGKGRADLWRAGKLDLSALTDARSNPLTLDQLEAQAGGG